MNLNLNIKKFSSSPVSCSPSSSCPKGSSGFTLLELLIVISIIAILSVALVVILDPAEALRKARDAQRISDTNTMKTALGLYLTSTSTPYLGGLATNSTCKPTPATAFTSAGTYKIWYSLPIASAISDLSLDGVTPGTTAIAKQATTPALVDSNGWIEVNFDTLIGGSPISNLPVDPINTISSLSGVASTDLVYRYACSVTPLAFEIDAQLESTAYTSADDKRAKDGGNSTSYYEVGTNLKIMGATAGGLDF